MRNDRVEALEVALAGVLDYVEAVGCFDQHGCRVTGQVPAVDQAKLVLGAEQWERLMRAAGGAR